MRANAADYLQMVGDAHRRAFGQFFTPPDVADFLVHWVLKSDNAAIHDPGFGLGAFLDAVPQGAGIAFSGSDIDPTIIDYLMKRQASENAPTAIVRHEDYLTSWGRKFGNIVCNPPYMRFQKFRNRKSVIMELERRLDINLPGYVNTASAFLLKSLYELQPRGRLAYIMPLEFLNTGYGSVVKQKLIEGNHLSAIISLDCEKDVFPDVITSVGIILYDSAKTFSHLKFFRVSSVESLSSILDTDPVTKIAYGRLDPVDNWFTYFERSPTIIDSQNTVPLEWYGRFKRGIATGGNKFFALRLSKVERLNLAECEVVPGITKSAQIATPFFTRDDLDNLARLDAPIYLFKVNGSPSDQARAYISYGEEEGFNLRYITRNRNPWYKIEERTPSPLLLGVFSRGGYKVVRNTSGALNLSCFHGFQPDPQSAGYVERLFLYLQSSAGREIVSLAARKYGDGLSKFEPNDLNAARVPSPDIFAEISPSKTQNALKHLKETGTTPDWLEYLFNQCKREPIAAPQHSPVRSRASHR